MERTLGFSGALTQWLQSSLILCKALPPTWPWDGAERLSLPHEALSPSLTGCPLTLPPLTVQGCSCWLCRVSGNGHSRPTLWNSRLVCRGASSGQDIRTLPVSPTRGPGEGLVGSGRQEGKIPGGRWLAAPHTSFPPLPAAQAHAPNEKRALLLNLLRVIQCLLLLIIQGDVLSVSCWCLGKLLIYVI